MPGSGDPIQLGNNVTELTAIAPLKPGGADMLRMIFGLRKKAEAGGEPSLVEIIQTIHYARWVIIDGGTRLLFTSNFDGNLEDYLEEFAERDEGPINGAFAFCEGWPGVRPAGPFIAYVRQHMIPSVYYYGAYPKYTVPEVKRALHWKAIVDQWMNGLTPNQMTDPVIADLLLKLAAPTPLRV